MEPSAREEVSDLQSWSPMPKQKLVTCRRGGLATSKKLGTCRNGSGYPARLFTRLERASIGTAGLFEVPDQVLAVRVGRVSTSAFLGNGRNPYRSPKTRHKIDTR